MPCEPTTFLVIADDGLTHAVLNGSNETFCGRAVIDYDGEACEADCSECQSACEEIFHEENGGDFPGFTKCVNGDALIHFTDDEGERTVCGREVLDEVEFDWPWCSECEAVVIKAAFEEEVEFDFTLRDEGSIALLRPLTPRGSAWLAENIDAEAQRWGSAVVIDRRFVAPIIAGLGSDGLQVRFA